jgi:DNA (cytosine-5)-methyltransferase 1
VGRYRVVDLFCGGGGFSLGAHSAGLAPCLAIDVDPILTSAFRMNFPATKLILSDISKIDASAIRHEAGGEVDGVFGGPPCQGFSSIGHRSADDPRRSLLGHFFRLVAALQPRFFVMENVQGLGYVDTKPVLDRALNMLPGKYLVLGPVILDAADYGAATKRPRLFVIGYDPTRVGAISIGDIEAAKKGPATVSAAIADLKTATPLNDEGGFDFWQVKQRGRPSQYAASLRQQSGIFSGHRRTVHTKEVTARFRKLKPGGVDRVGRHPRLLWSGQCPTLRAGTGSDHGSYQAVRPIHPDEPRVITVREAARLQGFPDRFLFHPTVWHSFRMIGNSVSPMLSKELFSLIATRIDLPGRFQEAAE